MDKDYVIEFEIEEDPIIEFEIEEGGGSMLPLYEGPYEVTPKVDAQVLETRNKSMSDDVTVKEIPYSVVENVAGGLTINIAF